MHLKLALRFLRLPHIGISAVTSTARRVDNEMVALVHVGSRLSTHTNPADGPCDLVVSNPYVLPTLARAPASQAIRGVDSPFREDGDLNGDAELDVADATVTTTVQALPSTSVPDREFAEDDGIPLLEDLGVSDAGVSDARVDAALAIPVSASARATSDRLVVAEALDNLPRLRVLAAVTKRHVVACALRSCGGVEGLENEVDDAVRRLTCRSHCSSRK